MSNSKSATLTKDSASLTSEPMCICRPSTFNPVLERIDFISPICSKEIPNLEWVWPTEILILPPARIWGFSLTQTGVSGNTCPKRRRNGKLSILMRTPISTASAISSKPTMLGVNMMSFGLNPANKPILISSIETVSNPVPHFFIRRSTLMLVKALHA